MRGVVGSEEEGTLRVIEGDLEFLREGVEEGTCRVEEVEGGEEKAGREVLGRGYESRALRPVRDFAAVDVEPEEGVVEEEGSLRTGSGESLKDSVSESGSSLMALIKSAISPLKLLKL
jgi:hypothetical protein